MIVEVGRTLRRSVSRHDYHAIYSGGKHVIYREKDCPAALQVWDRVLYRHTKTHENTYGGMRIRRVLFLYAMFL